jgi:tRNA pseudouridine13 synthase
VGGTLRARPDDFVVEEIPVYTPSGAGAHVFVTVEKRGLGTLDCVRRLAAALGVRADDVGSAGLKDKHAVTRQQLSLPPPVTPEAALAVSVEGVRVLAAARHPHKLRTGHLAGNRFTIVVRDPVVPAPEAAARAEAIFARLAAPPGLPNFYGEQRFGQDGANAELGRALVRGERVRAGPRERRLLLSALQSELFNRYLEQRLKDGLYHSVIAGDILLHGVPSGPMFGAEMRAPAEGTEAAARETAVLAEAGLAVADLSRVARLAPGSRRAIGVTIGAPAARATEDGALELAFTLPAGSYATVVCAEVC